MGGARINAGRPQDPNALSRERDAGEWTIIPAGERPGDIPEWPLPEFSSREATLWEMLWRKPQARMWERYGQELEVALYVRRLVEAEQPDSKVNTGTLVRQMGDALGLTTPGMRNNRWKIEQVEKPQAKSSVSRVSARDRLKVVHGGDE